MIRQCNDDESQEVGCIFFSDSPWLYKPKDYVLRPWGAYRSLLEAKVYI